LIYFIQAGSAGPIKIGMSRDFDRRLTVLSCAHYRRLRVLGLVDATSGLEGEIHSLFSDIRMRGEWFRPEAWLLAFIRKVSTLEYGPAPKPKPKGGK
jgi:hypothetical protein